ncbi:hypothetical protein EC973_005561 [Apophysomyces ossiformis]|uniref:Uncharacterized protein n=1 Tax=Apophysomyces ossiformis TaxID=679940 RepID=A0A8H7BKA3_9FUNG|nr:hypothetical protein EC973_005561 [Apophysomyces ossiformis]
MFNALSGIGGSGKSSNEAAENANTALSVTFTLCSLLGAPVYNIFGVRILIPAALCYVLYVGSYLSDSDGFTIAAGAILGIGAGFLWTAQAGIMMSYPSESEKGKSFSIFWVVFNMGSTIGAAVVLANEWTNVKAAVQPSSYYAFMIIMFIGSISAIVLLPANKVVRADGSRVSLHKYSNWRREALEVFKLFKDWRMLILIPLFIGSNWFYTYQFNVFNGPDYYFMIRARCFNNFFYWLFQILGAAFYGWLLDMEALGNRRRRAFIGNTMVLVVLSCLWIGCIKFQSGFTRESVAAPDFVRTDIYSPGYGGYIVLYALFGFADAIYQGFIYWLMGTMTNDTERAARYGGFYKTIQNAGNAIANQIDANKTPFMTELAVVFAINAAGSLLAYAVCWTVPDVTVETADNLEGGLEKETMVNGRIQTIEDGHKEVVPTTEELIVSEKVIAHSEQ